MIETSLSFLLVYYLLIAIGGLMLVWVGHDYLRRRRERRARRFVVLCKMCGYTFEDKTKEEVLRCPCCGRLTERRRVREI